MQKIGADIEYVAFDGLSMLRAQNIPNIANNHDGQVGCDGCGTQLEIRPTPQPATPEGVMALAEQHRQLLRQAAQDFHINVGGGGYIGGVPCGMHIHLDCESSDIKRARLLFSLNNVVGAACLMFDGEPEARRRSSYNTEFWRRQSWGLEYRLPASPPTYDHCLALYALATTVLNTTDQNSKLQFPHKLLFVRQRGTLRPDNQYNKKRLAENLMYLFSEQRSEVAKFEQYLGPVFKAVDDACADGTSANWWPLQPRTTRNIILATMKHWGVPLQKALFAPGTATHSSYSGNVPIIAHSIREWLTSNHYTLTRNVHLYALSNEQGRPPVAAAQIGGKKDLPATICGEEVAWNTRFGSRRRIGVMVGLREDVRNDAPKSVEIVKQIIQVLGLTGEQRTAQRFNFDAVPSAAYPNLGSLQGKLQAPNGEASVRWADIDLSSCAKRCSADGISQRSFEDNLLYRLQRAKGWDVAPIRQELVGGVEATVWLVGSCQVAESPLGFSCECSDLTQNIGSGGMCDIGCGVCEHILAVKLAKGVRYACPSCQQKAVFSTKHSITMNGCPTCGYALRDLGVLIGRTGE